MYPRCLLIAAIIICTVLSSYAQEDNGLPDKITNFPTRLFDKANKKASSLETSLNRQTEKYLQRVARREKKLKRQLSAVDSAKAQRLFPNPDSSYAVLAARVENAKAIPGKPAGGAYLANVDSLKTSLSFLQQNSRLLSSGDAPDKIRQSLAQVNELQSRLQQSDQVKELLKQREQEIRSALGQYTNLPPGMNKELQAYKTDYYYYSQQVKEYRDLLNDPDKMQQKALTLLNKLPAFQQFMQQHSQLAAMFALPANYGSPAGLAGLQTRDQVEQLIQNQVAAGGPNAQQVLQQNLQSAQSELRQLQNRLNQAGGSAGGDLNMPAGFTPNSQKTKTFLQRLEYGTNLQTAKSNYYFPTTTDIGLSVGYKLNQKSLVGVGASYKMGWGSSWNKIRLSHQGIGLRSFLDYKLKGSFYASGGFEYNYRQLFEGLLPGAGDAWQQSGLVGLSKVVSLKSKFFKQTKMQLLWDFLSYSQVPRTQELKFRVGYSF